MEKMYLYINETSTYNLGRLVIDGYEEEDTDFVPASIRDLRHDLASQKRLVELHLHPEETVQAWGGNGELLVLQEGLFQWSPREQDYVPYEG